MADGDDFSSDTSDDDYNPACDDVDSDDDKIEKDDDCYSGKSDDENVDGKLKKVISNTSTKRRKSQGSLQSRQTKRGRQRKTETEICPSEEQNGNSVITREESDKNESKTKVDLLWADFLKDVDAKPEAKKAGCSNTSLTSAKVKITKVFEFAGEEVRVTEEVGANSKEAAETEPDSSSCPSTPRNSCAKKPAGLGSILSKLGGPKKKLSTLEKSRLDWNEFKDKEGISDELKTHNRGKEGYLEKQAFLERADLRQYEIERSLRIRGRSNR